MKRLLVTLLLLTGSLIVVVPAGATFPGENGRISFSSDRSGRFQIYSQRPRGGALRQLTDAPGNSIFADWTPDGRHIVFDSDRVTNGCSEQTCNVEIFAMDADGDDVRRITRNPGYDGAPSVSPDGQTIAFESDRDGGAEIYTMSLEGGRVTKLTDNDAFDFGPKWSPDGSHIVFASDRARGEGSSDVYVMEADGSDARKLTPSRLNAGVPDWSPDGDEIVFASNAAAPGTSNLYVIESDGSELEQLTDLAEDESAFFPSWSPDGHRIAFSSQQGDNVDIATLRQNGSDVRRVTSSAAFDIAPDWGPRG